ncbi:hypothetical protein LCGC14_2444320, partial [marine sediment metagenome]
TNSGSFSYTIADNNNNVSVAATVSIAVSAVNDAPVASGDTGVVSEGTVVNLNVAANDSDADDGLDLSSINIVAVPVNGSFVVNVDGTVSYSHDGGETISDSFTYTINDASGATSNQATVNLTVNPVNDAAVVTITSPLEGEIFDLGQGITFVGTASDSEDGDLASSIEWRSDIDGVIGSGGIANVSALSGGIHSITASVVDSDGLLSSHNISITITRIQVSSLTFADPNLGICVFDEAVRLGYIYADEFTSLSCNAMNIADATGLGSLTNLQTLSLTGNQLTGIDASALVNLRYLYLADNRMVATTSIQGLSSLSHLIHLGLNNNQLSYVDLTGLTNLNQLTLDGNELVVASGMSDLINLASLHLNDNQLIDVLPLQYLTSLMVLSLEGNDSLGCDQLDALEVSLSDTGIFRPLHCLQVSDLFLGNTGLDQCVNDAAAINVWLYTDEITSLQCAGYGIAALYGIEKLRNLKYVDLSSNDLIVIKPLYSLDKLLSVDLKENNDIFCAQLDTLQNLHSDT